MAESNVPSTSDGGATDEKSEKPEDSSKYQYMSPSYVDYGDLNEAAQYPAISHALLENSSAHGLPTLYRARGELMSTTRTSDVMSVNH